MICSCGRNDDSTSSYTYQLAQYNERGEIIYAVCMHGTVVIDVREESKTDDNDTERLAD